MNTRDFSDEVARQRRIEMDRINRENVERRRQGGIGAIPGEEGVLINSKNIEQYRLYFVKDFRDTRISNYIVRGPKGTFYIGEKMLPPHMELEEAQFSYKYSGEHTVNWKGGYLVRVMDSGGGDMNSSVIDLQDEDVAKKIFVKLRNNQMNVELEGSKIYILDDKFYVERMIERELEDLATLGFESRKQTHKDKIEEFVDIDYDGNFEI